ncbi:centrosomal protein of 78 kDa isoform X2 [Tachypleus tridentatus]|uniref:centrosomal protein of 78 kDa isoform X2 n=1 Tax=Tachypleus tridentatus TaxID=6853 RepID=UPI003FCEEEFE
MYSLCFKASVNQALHGEAWQESLRYRCPNLDRLSGLRRITLNNNPDIADDGAVALANALQEDMWLKALDLQNCGIAVKGAQAFLTTLNVNIALEILDLRGNSKIGGQLMQQIMEKLKRNNEGKLCEYPWLPNENILSVSKSLPIRSRSSKPWARRAVEQKKRSLSADPIKHRNCLTKHSSMKLIKPKEELNEVASSCLSMSSSSAEELKRELKELQQCLKKEEAARKATESQLLDALLENKKLRSQLEQNHKSL